MSNLPQQSTINQYVADGITTIYNYTFLILSANASANDISVYVTPSGQPAVPTSDIQVLNEDYSVQNVGNVSGGTITFLPGAIPANGSIVTIVRTMNVSIDTEFAQAQNFNGANLDSAFERVVLIMQQLNTYYMNNALSYVINSYLPTLGLNFLPVLTNVDNQVWISQGGRIIAAVLQNDDMSTLRSQLASQVPFGDGASLIGFYDTVNNIGTTLDTFLNTYPRPNNGNIIIGGDMTTNPWQRSITFPVVTTNFYLNDRFLYFVQGAPTGAISANKVIDSPTVSESGLFGVNSIQIGVQTAQTVIAANDLYTYQYRVEGYDFTFIAQRNFTLSFWVKSNLPGIYHAAFSNGVDQSYVAPFTISGSNVWQKISITVPASPASGTWNYTNGAGLLVSIVLAAGSNYQGTTNAWVGSYIYASASQINFMSSTTNTINFDRFCLEPGNLSTPWVARSIEEELALCERYYQKSYNIADGSTTTVLPGSTLLILGGAPANNTGFASQPFRTRMRDTPTCFLFSPVTGATNNVADLTSATDKACTPIEASETGFYLENTSGGALTDTHVLAWHWQASAEL